jgi:hypothetical protein
MDIQKSITLADPVSGLHQPVCAPAADIADPWRVRERLEIDLDRFVLKSFKEKST